MHGFIVWKYHFLFQVFFHKILLNISLKYFTWLEFTPIISQILFRSVMFMGLFDYVKGQLLDVIEWEDNSQDTIVHKIDMRNNEIQNGAWLTVRPGQAAVFVNEGQIADVFGEGRHQLTTQNLPILTNLKHWAYGFNSPFKCDVYFVNVKQFMNQKWGTPTPIPVSDPKFEQVEIRAFGTFGFRVSDPAKFMREVVSTNREFTTNDIKEQLRAFIDSHFASIVGALNLTVVDYAKNYNTIANAIGQAIGPNFENIGLQITVFTVSSITLPEEVNKVLRMRTKANMLGGLGNYAQMESLDIMRESVKNPGMNGMSQAGIGLGMGLGMGNLFTNNMQGGLNNQTQFYQPQPATPQGNNPTFPQDGQPVYNGQPSISPQGSQTPQKVAGVYPVTPPPTEKANAVEVKESSTKENTETITCSCGATIPKTYKFCMECGQKVVIPEPLKDKFCPECGNKCDGDAKFCDECGFKF